MTLSSNSFGDDPLTSDRKREKPSQFKWKILVIVCATLFTFAISVVASSLLLYFVFCPDSTPTPAPAPTASPTPPTTTTTPWTTTTTPWKTTTKQRATTMWLIQTSAIPRRVSRGTIRLVERIEWGAAPPSQPLNKLNTPVQDVIISHTATDICRTRSACILQVKSLQEFHVASQGLPDIVYNFLIGGDGNAYVGRGWNYEGSATNSFNHRSISIGFIGTFNSVAPTPEQLQAARDLIQLGVESGKIRSDYLLLGHRQVSQTLSPGDELYKIIQTWSHWRPLL